MEPDRIRRVLTLSDPQAAVATVLRKAGKRRKARTRDLVKLVENIKARTDRLGPGAVTSAWVKAHIGLLAIGNERVDLLAKAGAEREARRPGVTDPEGG